MALIMINPRHIAGYETFITIKNNTQENLLNGLRQI